MSGFFQLIDDVVIGVLSLWIDTKSLAKLDSAFCNTTDRIYVLQLMSQSHFTTNYQPLRNHSEVLLNWCIVRKLRLRSFCIKRTNITGVDIARLDLSCVNVLVWILGFSGNDNDTATVRSIVNNCHSLEDMVILSARSDEQQIVLICPTILNRLKVFKLEVISNDGITLEQVQYIAVHCKVLSDIQLKSLHIDAVCAVAELILNNSNTLQHVCTRFNYSTVADTIVKAAKNCAHLTEFTMTEFQWTSVTLSDIAELFKANPLIKTLELWGELNLNRPFAKVNWSRISDQASLTLCNWLDNAYVQGWMEILYAVPKLHILRMSTCSGISVVLLQRVATAQSHLKSLVFGRTAIPCALQDLREIFPQCDELSIDEEKWTRGSGVTYKYL